MSFLLHKILNCGISVWVLFSPVFIERMKLVSRGKPLDSTKNIFTCDDRTIYCWVLLSKPAFRTRVRFEWKAISVEGINPEKTLMVSEYTTKLMQRFARGGFHCRRKWSEGKYSVATYLNGVRARAMDYEIVNPELADSLR